MANLKKNDSTFIEFPDNVFESSEAFHERLKRMDAWQKEHNAASPSWRKIQRRTFCYHPHAYHEVIKCPEWPSGVKSNIFPKANHSVCHQFYQLS